MIESYRGWEIVQSAEPVHGKFEATSPDYDVDCDQDGFFVCAGAVLHEDTIEKLKELIDEYILENEDAETDCVAET